MIVEPMNIYKRIACQKIGLIENLKFFSLIWRDILGDPGDLNQLSNLYEFRNNEENTILPVL